MHFLRLLIQDFLTMMTLKSSLCLQVLIVFYQMLHDIMDFRQRVSSFDRYNFLGACLLVPSSLNIPFWRSRLQDYPDYAVCDFLEFGRLVYITLVHFRPLASPTITRVPWIFLRGWIRISPWSLPDQPDTHHTL